LADLGYKAVLYEDNQGAIEISRNPRFHNRTKHIDVNEVYCPSSNLLADIMTKELTKEIIIIIMRCDSSL